MGARLPEELLPPRVVVSDACPSASGLYIAESDLATGVMRVIDFARFVLGLDEELGSGSQGKSGGSRARGKDARTHRNSSLYLHVRTCRPAPRLPSPNSQRASGRGLPAHAEARLHRPADLVRARGACPAARAGLVRRRRRPHRLELGAEQCAVRAVHAHVEHHVGVNGHGHGTRLVVASWLWYVDYARLQG